MIEAYLLGIPAYYEGEDIQIRFLIYKDGQFLFKENFIREYHKPALTEHVALIELLKRLEEFKEDDITIIINNPSLMEQIRGTSTNKNKEVLKMAGEVRSKLKAFGNNLIVKDVSNNKLELKNWKNIIEG